MEYRDEAKLWRQTYYAIGPRQVTLELSKTPLPFLDWGAVEAGHVGYLGEAGDVVPLAREHPYTDSQIRPVRWSVASGVRIRVQPPDKGGPLFEATYPWETRGKGPQADVLIDDEGLYRLWYTCDGGTAYAESEDLLTWRKPLMDRVPYEGHTRTNLIQSDAAHGLGSIFKDPNGTPEERYKGLFMRRVSREELGQFAQTLGKEPSDVAYYKTRSVFPAVSPDGISWQLSEQPVMLHFSDADNVIHFDPALKRYVGYFRTFEMGRRCIARAETEDFRDWPLPQAMLRPGPEDPPYVDFYLNAATFYPGSSDLRLIFCLAYDRAIDSSEIRLAVSRDGRAWNWVPGGPVLTPGEPGSADACFVFVRPQLVRTRDGRLAVVTGGYNRPHKFPRAGLVTCQNSLAWWREDRMAAVEAPERGEFTTVHLKLRAPRLLLNVQTERAGDVRVELRDEQFRPIPGRTLAEADPINGDHLAAPVSWRGESDLSAHVDRLIYLRFHLTAARLFAMKAGD